MLETGRWLLAGVLAVAWLLMLDAVAMAWMHRDRPDRVFLLFMMVVVTWAAAFEGYQAWRRYAVSAMEPAALAVGAFIWLVLWLTWLENRHRPTSDNGD